MTQRVIVSARQNDPRWTAALVIVLWVAFALRVTELDRQPLWWDEGVSIFFAHQNPSGLVSETLATSDLDPPVYRLALGVWHTFTGTTPFATRLLLVMVGVLTVALTWSVGRRLTNKSAAALAALLMAVAPFQVYYAREAKGYVLAALCALVSVYVWGCKLGYLNLSAPRDDRARWWVIYVLSTLAAIGTHYYLGLIVLWQGLWVAGSVGAALTRKSDSRQALTRLMRWALAALVMGLGLTPWVLTVFRTTVPEVKQVSQGNALSAWGYLIRVATEFSVGLGADGMQGWLGVGALTLLMIAGAVADESRPFLLTWFAVPLAAAFLIQASFPFFTPRFLLFLGPVCYILMGRGSVAIGRTVKRKTGRSLPSKSIPVLLAAAMVGLSIPGLARIYNKPIDEAEDVRPLMNQIRATAQPGDAVLTTYIWQDGYLISYVAEARLTSYRSSYSPRTVSSLMGDIFRKHERLWIFNYGADVHDTYNPLNIWLNRNTALAFDEFYGKMQLALFVQTDPPPAQWPDRAAFEQGITLDYVPPSLTGNTLSLNLRWQTVAPLEHTFKAFVHLRRPGDTPIAQSDHEPAGGLDPTDAWRPGQLILDRRALLVPRNASPGTYAVYVGLYTPENGTRLRVQAPAAGDEPDSVLVGYVDIAGRSN